MDVKVGDILKRTDMELSSWIDGGRVTKIVGNQVWLGAKDGCQEDWISLGHIESGKVVVVKHSITKNPTHLVVWDEEYRDPHRFFTSEKEAKDFVKELSKKSRVKKDSIILVVIKSVQKVSITNNVRLMNYKI